MSSRALVLRWASYHFLASFIFFSISTQASELQGKAVVRSLRGTAKYKGSDGIWAPLKVGKNLNEGDTVATGPESGVGLFLGHNGNVLHLAADPTLVLKNLRYDNTGADVSSNSQLLLSNGSMIGSVKKLNATSIYEIQTPVGIAGVRGTDYHVAVVMRDQQYIVKFTSIRGTLVATSIFGKPTIVINTGECWVVGDAKKEIVPAAVLRDLENQLPQIIVCGGLPDPPPDLFTGLYFANRSPNRFPYRRCDP